MTWTPTAPNGALSVSANQPIIMGNFTYTKTKMNLDHYWNIGDEDGRHKFVQMKNEATDPTLGTLMTGVTYLKETNGVPTGYFRNTSNVYEYIPTYKTGSSVLTTSYSTITSVPNNVWGEIFLWTDANANNRMQAATFRSTNSKVEGWSYFLGVEGTADPKINIKLGNGTQASGLNIRARSENAPTGQTWKWRVTFRAIV